MYDSTKTTCIGFLKKLHGKVPWCKLSWDQRILQVGRDIRMSLVQPPAQSSLSHEVRPERSGLAVINRILKTSKDRDCTTPLGTCLTAPKDKRFLPVYSFLLSCFNKCLLGLIFPPCAAVHSLAPPSR